MHSTLFVTLSIVRFYTAFAGLPCRPSHLPLFRRTPDLRAYMLAQDVIYVGGGNTNEFITIHSLCYTVSPMKGGTHNGWLTVH